MRENPPRFAVNCTPEGVTLNFISLIQHSLSAYVIRHSLDNQIFTNIL